MRRNMTSSVGIISTALAIVVMVLFWREPQILTPLVIILALMPIIKSFSVQKLVFGICMSFIGAGAEIVATYFHIWTYSITTFLDIPMWVPFIWVVFSFAIVEIRAHVDARI